MGTKITISPLSHAVFRDEYEYYALSYAVAVVFGNFKTLEATSLLKYFRVQLSSPLLPILRSVGGSAMIVTRDYGAVLRGCSTADIGIEWLSLMAWKLTATINMDVS
jgi:hypothetical protein